MNTFFPEIKKNFGFGCMRLPMQGDVVDEKEMNAMVDMFLERGFNYFDTAMIYLGGESERALKKCLTSRYPREAYVLTDKLSGRTFKTREDIPAVLDKQLKTLGVEYLDFYLMHAMNANSVKEYEAKGAFELGKEFKKQGKIRHFGISFHDTAAVLEDILSRHPEIEVVQLQFNYADYEDEAVQSRKCYEACVKYNKPVIVMEPVKGGSLIKLPEAAQAEFDKLGGGSNASYAIRFAAGFDNIAMVLSGMGSVEMMEDNTAYMQDFKPLTEEEHAAIKKVCAIFKAQDLIPCTACRYCTDGCPRKILIPDLFSCLNAKKNYNNNGADFYYNVVYTANNGKASDCIKCGKCEKACPQHLPIRKLLEDVAAVFEGGKK